jgi:A/G-specific adenine glycosylase
VSASSSASQTVADRLLDWYDRHARTLPWRSPPGSPPPDPYRVWLSEVMLQQTTTAAVAPYFARFTDRWPTVVDLVEADESAVMAAWAGLGYYSRARNLIAAARAVAARGAFPSSEAGLRELPGVGAYIAAAVAAIAFGRRAVVVDANIERVVARLFAIGEPLPQARKSIRQRTDELTPDRRAGDFAQAMMDLGATVCTPRQPRCVVCPLAVRCAARAIGEPSRYPVKAAKGPKPVRAGTAFWIVRNGAVWLVRRPSTGMLGGMRALPDDGWSAAGDGSGEAPISGEWREAGAVRHGFSHFGLVLRVRRTANADQPTGAGEWWPIGNLADAGLPTLFAKAAARALDDSAAEHQPQHRDHQHDEAEIPSVVRSRQRTDPGPQDCDGEDHPVAPAEQGNGRRNRQQQRDEPDENRNDIQHVS